MRRSVAVAWHASFFTLAGVLYFFFVLPRWFELTGIWTPALGTPVRIADGVLLGLCALPVVFTLLRTRKPEFGTPQLALSLRLWSIVLHVLAGVLVAGTAIAEIWISLDRAGQWMFGSYGAAAAIAVLGALAFYLAYLAEQPPPPPRPLKVKTQTSRRGRRKAEADDAADADDHSEAAAQDVASDAAEQGEVSDEPTGDEPTAEPEGDEPTAEPEVATDITPEPAMAAAPDEESDGDAESKLRNRRPGDRSTTRRFRRRRGGVALDD